MTRPGTFLSPIFSKMESSGYISDWKGTSMAAVNARKRMFAKIVLLQTIAQAANEDTMTISRMEKNVTAKVIPMDLQKLICSIAFLM